MASSVLPVELIPRQPLANDLMYYDVEAVAIVHLAVIVAEHLLVHYQRRLRAPHQRAG